MNFTEIKANKTLIRDELKNRFNLPKRSKTLIVLNFSKVSVSENLLEGLEFLPANFIVAWIQKENSDLKNTAFIKDLSEIDIAWIDAIVCDCSNTKLENIMENGIVPIVNTWNYLWKILTEFNAGRGEGNSYLYEWESHWSAYYALVRYLENLKFPYDNRNLVKNVLWI